MFIGFVQYGPSYVSVLDSMGKYLEFLSASDCPGIRTHLPWDVSTHPHVGLSPVACLEYGYLYMLKVVMMASRELLAFKSVTKGYSIIITESFISLQPWNHARPRFRNLQPHLSPQTC
jgi:hypothetical protein